MPIEQRIEAYKAFLQQNGMVRVSCVSETTGKYPRFRVTADTRDGKHRSTEVIVLTPAVAYRVVVSSRSDLSADPVIERFLRSFAVQ